MKTAVKAIVKSHGDPAVVEHIRTLVGAGHFGLVENLADRIARMIIADFNAPRAKVSIAKLGVVKNAKHVGVCVERTRG